MPQNFVACDHDQEWLLPPSLREWLPEDHLAWLVLEAVEELDLAAFYASYRADGHGRAALDPAMMVALLVYAYAVGVRSSRGIERHSLEDVAFRVITAQPGAGSRDDRALSCAARDRDRRAVRTGAGVVRPRRPGRARSGRDRWDQDRGQRDASRDAQLRANRTRDPGRG